MGRKSVVKSFKMLDDADGSGNLESTIVNIINLDKASIRLEWDGTVDGEFKAEVRNGEDESFYELDFNASILAAGSPGDHILVLNELPFTDIKITFTSASGSGNVNAVFTSKVVGA